MKPPSPTAASVTYAMKIVSVLFAVLGLLLIVAAIALLFVKLQQPIDGAFLATLAGSGAVLVVLGGMGFLGRLPTKFGPKGAEFEPTESTPDLITSIGQVEKVRLPEEAKEEGRSFAQTLNLPGRDAPPFRVLAESAMVASGLRPAADPTTPMYTLDKNYRILDWNEAFSLAFDRSMEGLRGVIVTEWIFHLVNYNDVLRRAERRFGNPNAIPRIDVEEIAYSSKRYGDMKAIKRAYQIPGDDEECIGWLVVLEPMFASDDALSLFHSDLIRIRRMDLLWSEYSISYDQILCNTKVYPDFLREMVSGKEGERPLPPDVNVLDLGAGTGNITHLLADPKDRRNIVAVDNNRMMLSILNWKCRKYLKEEIDSPGVKVVKQNILSLYGLEDEYFDYTMLNNVLYALGDQESVANCLSEVNRVMKFSGEIRISGPQKTTDIDFLFTRIKSDLEKEDLFEKYKADYERVEEINKNRLRSLLYNFDLDTMENLLKDAGFGEILYKNDKAYGGTGMIIFAAKSDAVTSSHY